MNKREFNERMKVVTSELDKHDGYFPSCFLVIEEFPENIVLGLYKKFISEFISNHSFYERYYPYRVELRFYLLEQFIDHCLRTGIYKEF